MSDFLQKGCFARTCQSIVSRHALTIAFALLGIVVWSAPTFAQTITGTISGTVIDPNGAVVAGANVTLHSDQTADKRDQVTNESGRFSFAAVRPGIYSI